MIKSYLFIVLLLSFLETVDTGCKASRPAESNNYYQVAVKIAGRKNEMVQADIMSAFRNAGVAVLNIESLYWSQHIEYKITCLATSYRQLQKLSELLYSQSGVIIVEYQ